MTAYSIALALILLTLGGGILGWLAIQLATFQIKSLRSAQGLPEELRHATATPTFWAGFMIGALERLLFFGALWMRWPEVIAGWFVFKAAAKWEAWSNIVKVPNSFQRLTVSESLRARYLWSQQVLTRSLVGALANLILAGAVVAYLRRWF